MPHSTIAATADALLAGLDRIVDVVRTSLPDVVARLVPGGERPTLYLDDDSPDVDLCWAMLDVLRVLTVGPNAAVAARPVTRHLSLVG